MPPIMPVIHNTPPPPKTYSPIQMMYTLPMHIDYLTPLLHYKLRYRYGIEQLIRRPRSNLITKLLVPITNETPLAIYMTFLFHTDTVYSNVPLVAIQGGERSMTQGCQLFKYAKASHMIHTTSRISQPDILCETINTVLVSTTKT